MIYPTPPKPQTTPTPGATQRKKPIATPKTKPPTRPRKLLTPEELTQAETQLALSYYNIIPGTLYNATKDTPTPGLTDAEVWKYRHKRSIRIKCACGEERRIATSDLHQSKLCPKCTKNARNTRKRACRTLTRNNKEQS